MKNYVFTILLFVIVVNCNNQRKKDVEKEFQLENQQDFNDKLNTYIAVNNFFVHEHRGNSWQQNLMFFYLHYGNPKNTSLKHKGTKLWHHQGGIEKIIKPALKEIDKKPNLDKLDSLEQIFCNQILRTTQLFDKFNEYYLTKEYLEDNYTEAPKIYQQIIRSLQKDDSLYQLINSELTYWINKRDKHYLAQTKNNEPLNYQLRYSIIKSKELLEEIEKQNISNENIIDLNPNPLLPIINEIKFTNKELSSLIYNEKEIKKSALRNSRMLKPYKSNLEGFIGNLNVLVKKVTKKQSFSEKDIERMQHSERKKEMKFILVSRLLEVDGSINSLYNDLHSMIESYNYLCYNKMTDVAFLVRPENPLIQPSVFFKKD